MTSENLLKELKKLVAEYGADETVKELKAITGRSRGNPKIHDWDDLEEVLEADVLDILEDRDPRARQGDVSIAKQLANAKPRHSEKASKARIRLKLDEERLPYATAIAGIKSMYAAPYQRHLAILGMLADGEIATVKWQAKLAESQKVIADYVGVFGDPPESMTMAEITAKVTVSKEPKVSGFGLWGNTSVK
jgi:hypothetical protein